jgi:hypothetical protein
VTKPSQDWSQISLEIGRGLEKERQKQFRYVKDMFELVAKNLSAVPRAKEVASPKGAECDVHPTVS